MKGFWFAVAGLSAVGVALMTVAAVGVATRPHAGHRGPPNWEAAAILLFVAVGLAVLVGIAVATYGAIRDE